MIERFEDNKQTIEQSKEMDESVQRNFRPIEIGDQARQGDWVDVGMQDVPVAAIDVSDTHVHSVADFSKVSHQDMVRGFNVLEKEVQPALANGADGEYFRSLDEQNGKTYSSGTQKIYEAFYGDNAIRLTKDGDTYRVTNGYHRLYVAKELGVPTVPAHVIEKQYH